MKPGGNRPDAVLLTKTYGYAVEYEHSEKRLERYKTIMARYAKENYDRVLYIVPSETLRERILKKCELPKHVYFIEKETLFREREEAVFFSSSDGLPLKELVRDSTRMNFRRLDPSFIAHFVRRELNRTHSPILAALWDDAYDPETDVSEADEAGLSEWAADDTDDFSHEIEGEVCDESKAAEGKGNIPAEGEAA